MLGPKLAAVFLVCLSGIACAQQPPNMPYKIRTLVNSVTLKGETELDEYATSHAEADVQAEFERNVLKVDRGESFQLNVFIVDQNGLATDVSQSANLAYMAHGCLEISATGLVTATPSTKCISPDNFTLWIGWKNAAGDVVAWNTYTVEIEG